MKSVYILLPFFGSALALVQYPPADKCVATCPKTECNIYDTAERCKCNNDREKACKKKCPQYKPVILPCTFTPPPPETCECEQVFCVQSFPESCYCSNAAKEACYNKCGGVKPVYQTCPPRDTTTLTIMPAPTTKPSYPPVGFPPGPTYPPAATPINQLCGGGRTATTIDCPAGWACIANPFVPGSCGPACDQFGICAVEKMCGGFRGAACDDPAMVCMDDPRDDCDPMKGGADCGGLCVYPERV